MRVCSAVDIGTRRVDGRMDHERRFVQQSVRARLLNLHSSMVVDEDEIAWLDQREVLAL